MAFPGQQPPMPPQGGAPQPPPQGGAPAPQPPQGAAPPPGAPPGGGQAVQLPPGIARHIDPNNAIQMLLMQRVDKFTPQDGMAIGNADPAVVAALKKLLPEIAFMFDLIVKRAAVASGRAQPMARPGAGAAPPQPGAMPPGAPPQGAPPPAAQPGGPPRPSPNGLSRF
jgi:hypothetical protein